MTGRILVVCDDPSMRQTLDQALGQEGYDFATLENGDTAIVELQASPYDLMLIDLTRPPLDGVDLLEFTHQYAPDTLVILLTGHGSLDMAIQALRFGAHDYFLKPAATSEILNSIQRGLARRAEQERKRLLLDQLGSIVKNLIDIEGAHIPSDMGQQVYVIKDGVTADLDRREVWRGNQRVVLTPTEGKLMNVLLENRGRVMSHRELVLLVHGYNTTDWEAPEVLRPLISRLRRKLRVFPNGENWITNVRGTGYVFNAGTYAL